MENDKRQPKRIYSQVPDPADVGREDYDKFINSFYEAIMMMVEADRKRRAAAEAKADEGQDDDNKRKQG